MMQLREVPGGNARQLRSQIIKGFVYHLKVSKLDSSRAHSDCPSNFHSKNSVEDEFKGVKARGREARGTNKEKVN